jgi:hypothetical protein
MGSYRLFCAANCTAIDQARTLEVQTEQGGIFRMNQGQCLCGTVRYEVDGPYASMMNCHCSMCRKHHGAPFATFVTAALAGFRWVSGEDSISRYGSRSFCRVCGSVTPLLMSEAGLVICPAGNLGGDLGIKPQSHMFTGSKAPWYNITDSLPQHEEYPPEFGMSGVERPRVEPKPGIMQGSCLCGEMAFEIEGKPDRMFYCHCSRCRRSRSAAHGANLFFKTNQFRWVRGQSNVVVYKDPGARFFSAQFCKTCGSGAPRINPQLEVGYVPAGSLDTMDLSSVPVARIFVGSKASWVDISDALPRYEEMPPRPGA